jgi:hypothetical protein
MSPDQLTAIAAIITLLERIGVWPIFIFFALLGASPVSAIVFITRTQEKRIRDDERKFIEMKQMYENNVKLVENYEKTAESLEKMAQGLIDLVSLNTAKFAEVSQKIDTNQYCPAHRTTKIRMETIQDEHGRT